MAGQDRFSTVHFSPLSNNKFPRPIARVNLKKIEIEIEIYSKLKSKSKFQVPLYKMINAQKAKINMRRSPTLFLRAYRRESLYPSEEAEHPHLDKLQRSPQPSTQLNQIQIFCTYIEKTLNI